MRDSLSDATVGTPVTIYVGSDRYPGTVVKVVSPKTILVQYDDYKVLKADGPVIKEYEVIRNEKGRTETFTLRKNGRIVIKGTGLNGIPSLSIGKAEFHRDPHF